MVIKMTSHGLQTQTAFGFVKIKKSKTRHTYWEHKNEIKVFASLKPKRKFGLASRNGLKTAR